MSQSTIRRTAPSPSPRPRLHGWDVRRLFRRHHEDPPALRTARRITIGVMGSTVLLIGAALFILPGPGFPILLAGLAILGTEFVWARRLMRRSKVQVERGTRWWNRWWKKFRGKP